MPIQPEGILKSAKEQPKDFESQLKDLAEKLEKSQREGLDREDVITVISRVFEHSITDGLTMAQKLRLTPAEIVEACTVRGFLRKHGDVARGVHDLTVKQQKPEVFSEIHYVDPDEWPFREPEALATKILIKAVDALFAPLLAARELKLEPISKGLFSKGLTKAELKAKMDEANAKAQVEGFLSKVKRAYEHSYYTGPVRDVLKNMGYSISALDSRLKETFISESKLREIVGGTDDGFESVKQYMKDARYLLPDGVIQLEQRAAEKVLIGDLEKHLGSNGEVFLNHDTGKYEIKMNEQEKKEEKKAGKKEEPSEFETIEHLEKLLKEGAKPEIILYSLNGLDTDTAWQWRTHLRINNLISNYQLLESIAGLDSEDAWVWRREIRRISYIGGTAFGLAGLDSPRAWDMREELYKEGLDPNLLVKSLVGLDSPKAWEWRSRLMENAKNDSMLQSLAGLDSAKSWQWREEVAKYAGATPQGKALSLVGVDSPNAREWRERLARSKPGGLNLLLKSLTGLDTVNAWNVRKSYTFEKDVGLNADLAKSLVGIHTKKSKDFLNKIELADLDFAARAEAFIGDESGLAWSHREWLQKGDGSKNEFAIVAMILKNQKLRKEKPAETEGMELTEDEELDKLEEDFALGGNANEILELTAGMDSERAWRLRQTCWDAGQRSRNDRYKGRSRYDPLSGDPEPESTLNGLAFVNSERAWEERNNYGAQMRHVEGRIASTTGLDDKRAWNLREALSRGGEGRERTHILNSLMGIDTEKAWNYRNQYFEDSKTILDREERRELLNSLVLSTAGLKGDRALNFRTLLDSKGAERKVFTMSANADALTVYKRLLRERRGGIQKDENPLVQKLLKELNIVHHPTLEGINEYFAARGNPEEKESLTTGMASRISQTIQEAPGAFLDTIAAKRDRNPEMLAKLLFERIYPDTVKPKKEVGLTTRIASFFGMGPQTGVEDIRSFIQRAHENTLEGGSGEGKDMRSVVEFRNAIDELLVTDVYGAYDDTTGQWRTAQFPVAKPRSEPMRQTTGTITNVKGLTEIALPKPLTANLIEGRVKGVLANGTEVTLETSSDHLGIAVAINKPGVERVLYSIEYETAPRPMQDVSEREYTAFRRRFTVAEGKQDKEKSALAVALPDLPENIVQHILTPEFKQLTPKEQVQDIENYVRSVGYYDTKNNETKSAKQGKPLKDKFFLAEMRAEELKAANTPGLEGKKFAGVCADYATITCALLRKAGFLSGVVSGMHPEGTKAMVRDSHATAYVVWPTPEYENQVVIVDGTPASANPDFAYVEGKTIAEREESAHVEAEEAVLKAKKELKEIGAVLKSQDAEAIKKLSNGKLERALNTILHHEVTELHTDILKEMLNVYWYGGLNKLEGIQSDLEMRKAMEDILDARRLTLAKEGKGRQTGAGTELFEAMQDFLRKYKKATGERDSTSSLDALERIGVIAKESLQPTERQALDVIVTYLRAKKVG